MGGYKGMENKIKVAVYGSLKKGYGNHDWHLKDAEYLGQAETLPQYSLFSLGSYPGVIKGGSTCVQLELYNVNEEELNNLDRLEGHPSYYQREEIETSEGTAWIYLLPEKEYKDYEVIADGNW
jgi:gamma-glutamylcyclotransferase (GGCT)/AIG2-like uncharacterized protein YtfP